MISSSILTSGFHCASPVTVVNRHASRFSVFWLSCHFLLHLANLSVSFWILLCASSLSGCEDAIAKSSPKALTSVSLPNSSRSVGDRTAPCGRPHLNTLSLLVVVLTLTAALLFSSLYPFDHASWYSLVHHFFHKRSSPHRIKRPRIVKQDHYGSVWWLPLKSITYPL